MVGVEGAYECPSRRQTCRNSSDFENLAKPQHNQLEAEAKLSS